MVHALFEELSGIMLGHVPNLKAEPLAQLEMQAQAAVDRLRENCPEFKFDLANSLRSKPPLHTDSPERRSLLEQPFRRQVAFDEATAELDYWLQECQAAGGLHMISGLPDEQGNPPFISFVCIPTFPDHPPPDDLRLKLHFEQFFDYVKRFPGFPNVMTIRGDGWAYWGGLSNALPDYDWTRERIKKAIRIRVHKSFSLELLPKLLAHENLYPGARCILLGLDDGRGVALFDNPKVNAVYAIQRIDSELSSSFENAFAEST